MSEPRTFPGPTEMAWAKASDANPLPDDLYNDVLTSLKGAVEAAPPGAGVVEIPYTHRMKRATAAERIEVGNRLQAAGWGQPTWDDGKDRIVLTK